MNPLKSKINLFFIAIFFFFIGCSKETPELNIPPEGEKFGIRLPMEFYFSNNEGFDLIDLHHLEIIPFVYIDDPYLYDDPQEKDTLRFYYNLSECYNGSMPPWSNYITYREEQNKYAWRTDIYGKTDYSEVQTFIFISNSDIDTFSAVFGFSTESTFGSRVNYKGSYFANIDKLFYNDVLIWDNENQSQEFVPKSVFITKENGKTEITFE